MALEVGEIITRSDPTEAARRVLKPEHCALLVVDLQEKLLPQIFERERLLKNSQLLIRAAKIFEVPVLATTQYAKGLGGIVPEVASLLPGAPIDKLEFGCFGCDVFRSALKTLPGRRNTLLICGIEAHICVTQTVIGALNDGYLVHLASDAVSSRTERNWQVGLRRMEAAGAVISSTEMMIYELAYSSGSAAFKQLLPYLKG